MQHFILYNHTSEHIFGRVGVCCLIQIHFDMRSSWRLRQSSKQKTTTGVLLLPDSSHYLNASDSVFVCVCVFSL